jgi:uncharacterized protein (TIGR03086 family)
MTSLNIEPATTQLGELVRAVPDARLGSPTPSDCTVGELLDHVQMLARAFTGAAEKADDQTTSGPPPPPDAERLGDDWRGRIPALLNGLSAAWNEPSAWEGMTRVGGMEMPGEAAGIVALDEVVLHGWDLAVGSGQAYDVSPDLLEALVPFLEHMAEPGMEAARVGLFGPVVRIPENAPLLQRVVGLSGRDPGWRAG